MVGLSRINSMEIQVVVADIRITTKMGGMGKMALREKASHQ